MVNSIIKASTARVALLISLYFPPEPGGGSMAAWNRATILHMIGYKVYVICGFPSYPTGKVSDTKYKGKLIHIEKEGNFNLIRLRLLPLESKGYFRRFILFINFIFLMLICIPKILRIPTRIELVYAMAPILFSSFIGFLYSKLTKSFFIYEASALWPEELVAFKTRLYSIISIIGKVLAKVSYSLPDMIVLISNMAAEHVTKNYKPRVSVYALPIGVDPSKFPSVSMESCRQKLIGEKIFPDLVYDKFIVLYAGIISKVTRIENFVYAANKLKDDVKDIVIIIVGNGERRKQLEKIKSHHKIENLFFIPFQPGEIVPYIIAAADVCVVSLSSEFIYDATVPTKFFDYLACNKPIIGICKGEVAKIIESNTIGYVVKDGDVDNLAKVILSMKNSPATVRSMQINSQKVLKDFTLSNLALNFDKALKNEIMKKRNRTKVS